MGTMAMMGGGYGAPHPSWVPVQDSLECDCEIDFANDRAWISGGVMTSSQAVSVTRSTSGVYIDAAGSYQTAAADTLRLTHDAAALTALGALVEEARTNSIRNSTMQGVAAGTPGTAPSTWSVDGAENGLTRTIVGSGTENGIDYIEVRWAGTASATSNILIRCNTLSHVVAAQGQTWTGSAFVKLQAGTLTGLSSVQLKTSSRSSGGTQLDATTTTITPTGAGLATQRSSATVTNADATTAFEALDILLNYTSGGVVDITLRIGWPQLEQGLWETSPIKTTSAAASRSADVVTMSLPGWLRSQASYTMLISFTPRSPTTYATNQNMAGVDDSSNANRLTLRRGATTGPANLVNTVASSDTVTLAGAVLAQNTAAKMCGAWTGSDFALSVNGAAVVTSAVGSLPSTIDRLTVGANGSGANFANGTIALVALWNDRLTNASLQSLAT